MKKRIFLCLTVLAATGLFSCHSQKTFDKHGGIEVLLTFEGYAQDKYPEIEQMLKIRLEHLTKGEILFSRTPQGIEIKIPGVYDEAIHRVEELLRAIGEFGFWETKESCDVYPILKDVNENLIKLNIEKIPVNLDTTEKYLPAGELVLMEGEKVEEINKENFLMSFPLYWKLMPSVKKTESGNYTCEKGPSLGYVVKEDTSAINKYFNLPEIKAILPPDLDFRWTAVPTVNGGKEYFQLIAIQFNNVKKRPVLDGKSIIAAQVNKSSWGGFEVNISMNDEGALVWAKITKENIGKSIAMIVDGAVYSFPWVQSEIKGGKSQISGNFTKEEAEDLCALLKSKALPVPLQIIDVKVAKR